MTGRTAPAVVEVEAGRHWLVESRSFAPCSSWSVTYAMEEYGTEGRQRWEMRCPCPHGARQVEFPLEGRRPCAHLYAVVAFQDAKARRPRVPVNASMFVD